MGLILKVVVYSITVTRRKVIVFINITLSHLKRLKTNARRHPFYDHWDLIRGNVLKFNLLKKIWAVIEKM